MANFNITINNSLNTFGPAPTDVWNAWRWNAFKWGEGTSDLQVFVNLIVNTSDLVLDSSITTFKSSLVTIDVPLSVATDMYRETLSDGSRYNYVYPSNTTNAEERNSPTYTPIDAPTTSWSSAAAGTTVWS